MGVLSAHFLNLIDFNHNQIIVKGGFSMKRRMVILAVVLTLLLANGSAAQEKVGTGFTYQGFLKDGGSPANGAYDFEFALFDVDAGGNQIGGTVTVNGQSVVDGLFTVTLDFGADPFAGGARWLEIRMRPGASTEPYTTLSPRQALSPAPYATYAEHAPWEGRIRLPELNSGSLVDDGGVGNVGQYSSATIGVDGLGLISYYDATNSDLKVAHCLDAACTAVTVSSVDTGGDVGRDNSIAIGTDGLGLISYYDVTSGDLKVAHCNDLVCSSATVSTLDSTYDVGLYTSITIGADGLGFISYYYSDIDFLKAAHCNNAACTSATTSFVGMASGAGFTSVATGADGLPVIAWYNSSTTDLNMAFCQNATCSTVVGAAPDYTGNVGLFPSIAIGIDGLPLVSYYDVTNGDLKVAHCQDATCSLSSANTVDDGDGDDVGLFTSVTIGADGLGLVSYYDNTNGDLKVAHCTDVACSSVVANTVDSAAVDVGRYNDFANGDLKVLHCVNAFCSPNFWRR
jgi:hypothetical protein